MDLFWINFLFIPVVLTAIVWGIFWLIEGVITALRWADRDENNIIKFKNPIPKLFGKEVGWKRSPAESYWRYYKGPSYAERTKGTDFPEDDQEWAIILTAIPIGVWWIGSFVFFFPLLGGIILLIAGLIFGARLLFDTMKRLNVHIEDKDAHTSTDDSSEA